MLLEIVLVGAPGVGKTTLANVLTGKTDSGGRRYEMTLGIDITEKRISLDKHELEVIILDTAGHSLYSWLTEIVFNENALFLYCIDLADSDSVRAIDQIIQRTPRKLGVLVCCKADLTSRLSVPVKQAEQLAAKNSLFFLLFSKRLASVELEKMLSEPIAQYVRSRI